ncbi:MAG: oxygen-dependent coproporphyrinogen oxidase [Deltaproteobacteria bacterium]|nr:oxygen-dependent coproporphyrinogen oxidase [Deltaproteobacteria bacterium]
MTAPPTDDVHLPALTEILLTVQDEILAALEALEPTARFRADDWQRDPVDLDDPPAELAGQAILQGGGRTRVLEGGDVFERAGVNFSSVWGRFSPGFAESMPVGDGDRFAAAGLSLVIHPRNPHAPTVHLNYRRMVRGSAGWFGGGADLTPYVLYEDDARHFHGVLAAVCGRHGDVADYAAMKAECDRYFRNRHRDEARGVGGIFFDWMRGDDAAGDAAAFDFVADAARSFLPAYLPIVCDRRHLPYGEAERDWQLHRRGRYVEFNLIHDRGTVFGLRTGGRTESILMSLPPEVRWSYAHAPVDGSPEAALLDVLRTPRDWV